MKPRQTAARRRAARGLSYVEVMVAVVLLVVALVPATNALRVAVAGTAVHQSRSADHHRLRAKLEEVAAKPFTQLYALTYAAGGNSASAVKTGLSDAAGADRRVVYLYRTDGSALSTADTGLLRIAVAYENGTTTLETLKGRWW